MYTHLENGDGTMARRSGKGTDREEAKDKGKIETGKRIKQLREDILQMTQQEFARCFEGEFSRGAVGNWERGEGVKLANLRRISARFGIDINWLTTGAGTPTITKRTTDESLYNREPNSLDVMPVRYESAARELVGSGNQYRAALTGSLPEIDVQRGTTESAGLGELPIMDDLGVRHRVTAEWLLSSDFVDKEARVRRQESIILGVIGDSMFPNYNTGDRVIVDLSQRELLQDAVYAITDGRSAPQIKRLQRVFHSNPERVRIISDNPAYAMEEHPLADVEILGRVCGIIARR